MNETHRPVPKRCPFCDHLLDDYSRSNCNTCNFPVFGTEKEQLLFRAQNKALRIRVEEAESSFSSARFFMLWPPLFNIVLWVILKPLTYNPRAMMINIGASAAIVSFFFLSQRRPLPVMMLYAAIVLSLGLVNEFLGVTRLQWFGVLMVMFSQLYGIYNIIRLERALREKRLRENLPL